MNYECIEGRKSIIVQEFFSARWTFDTGRAVLVHRMGEGSRGEQSGILKLEPVFRDRAPDRDHGSTSKRGGGTRQKGNCGTSKYV